MRVLLFKSLMEKKENKEYRKNITHLEIFLYKFSKCTIDEK